MNLSSLFFDMKIHRFFQAELDLVSTDEQLRIFVLYTCSRTNISIDYGIKKTLISSENSADMSINANEILREN